MANDFRMDTTQDVMWSSLIGHLTEVLGDSACSPKEMFERYAYLLETYYPDFRFTVMERDLASPTLRYHLLMQSGFPVSMQEFEEMINENDSFMRAYELAMRARFVENYDSTDSLRGNIFDEGCAAHIPICFQGTLYGWLTLSSTDSSYRWSEKEKWWLPLTGRICGSFINLEYSTIDLYQRMDHVRENAAKDDARASEARLEMAANLTQREKEVLACLGEGLSNAQISEKLFISESTARKHVENIFNKLNVNNRTQAALVAQRL